MAIISSQPGSFGERSPSGGSGRPAVRHQLTLFVAEPLAAKINTLREKLDPVQAGLIAAHVTLCREDEIDGLSDHLIWERVAAFEEPALVLKFGAPERFQGHGVLLPCVEGANEFARLRSKILDADNPRNHSPHLTLAHPRNPRSLLNTDECLSEFPPGITIDFATVSLIRQEGTAAWTCLAARRLGC